MNLQAAPTAISDQEFLWCENFIKLGDANLRTAWDAGTALYQAPPGITIVSFYAYTIGTNYFFAVFLSEWSALQVDWPSGAVRQIGPVGTFYNAGTGFIPACTQWGVQYLLISNRNTSNDYWVWDGSILYETGSAAPNGVNIAGGGSNYSTPPNLTIYGGSGSGIAITPVINNGSVVELNITNPGVGYEVGDIPQIAFQGGGSDNSAILTANVNSTGVASLNITSPGSNYTHATIAFSGGGGSGAAATAIIGSGVSALTITAMGSGYTGANISFSGGGGSGATADAIVNGGEVVGYNITNPGSGYSSAPGVTITGDGSGATATATVTSGQVVGATMTNPGSGYVTAPGVTITGDGAGATATAVLRSGNVQSVTITNPGTGFFQPPLITFEGGGAPTAIATGVTFLTGTSVAKINVLAGGQNYGNVDGSPPVTLVLAGKATKQATASATIADGHVITETVTSGGAGYELLPLVVFNNLGKNTGSGAVGQAILEPTTILKAEISNYGQNYSSAPTIVIAPGSNNAAYATISLMPFGVSGLAMETYQQRVWIANPAQGPFSTLPPQGNFFVTAPGSVTDVATSDGGVIFTNSDRFLQTEFVAIRQSSGYNYFFGDASVSVVSSVQTNGNPPTTTFNYQTVDPQVGCGWRDTVQDFGRTILFANKTGVYGVYGGSAVKLSGKLDRLFLKATFPPTGSALTPTSAVAHLFEVKHYLMLMTVLDPDLGMNRNMMITWNEKEWSITSQSLDLTYIGTQKVASQLFAWGTDGNVLCPLFAQPSATLTKRLDTKLFGASAPIVSKDLQGFYVQAQDESVGKAGVEASIELAVSGIAVQVEDFPTVPSGVYTQANYPGPPDLMLFMQPDFPAEPPGWPVFGAGVGGMPFMNLGVRLTTTSPDFTLAHMLLSYTDGPPLA